MTRTHKIYFFIGFLLLLSMGAWAYTGLVQLSRAEKIKKGQQSLLQETWALGQETFNFIYTRQAHEKMLEGSQEKLTIESLNRIAEKHSIRQSSGGVTTVRKPTYIEQTREVQVEDQHLQNIVQFMLDIENSVKNTKISVLNFRRNRKDKDLWSAAIKISTITLRDTEDKKKP